MTWNTHTVTTRFDNGERTEFGPDRRSGWRRRARSILLSSVLISLTATVPVLGSQLQVIQDVKGRTVEVPSSVRRILIDDGRFLLGLLLIHPDPVSLLAGWPRDINRIGKHYYERLRREFPAIEDVPRVSSSAGTFSLEQALAVKPDVAILSLGRGATEEDVRRARAAGVEVVFIDFFVRPFRNTDSSLEILGKIVGRQKQAEEYIAFRRERLNRIRNSLQTRPTTSRPKVFLEAHAGISGECCNSPGKGNIGDYIALVGGHNIGADVLPGASGRLNVEYIVSQDPQVYIATGGPHLENVGGLVVGESYSAGRARAALSKIASRPALSLLTAVRQKRTHGLSHQLLNSPLDILAVEVLARWIHPDLFASVDPEASLNEINERFLAVPLKGAYWIGLK